MLTRKKFLSLLAAGSASILFGQNTPNKKPKSDPLPSDLVKDWIGSCHGNFERVKELYAKEPRLLNAVRDHGDGDFESGLEAAGHVGNRDIALFLLENGARMNIFCAAMLGYLPTVKAILKAHPSLKTSSGPHGLKLIHHAEKGGKQAAAVLKYLKKIGAE